MLYQLMLNRTHLKEAIQCDEDACDTEYTTAQALQFRAGKFLSGSKCYATQHKQVTTSADSRRLELESTKHRTLHGQLVGVDEVERLGHGNEHLLVHALRHALS